MLELDKLTRRFGERVAVADVTLAVPGGQMVGVIGRSGAGKSTLLRMVNRLLDPSAGHGESHLRGFADISKGIPAIEKTESVLDLRAVR